MNSRLNNIILCGGRGSRLWPLSRPEYPKQFLKYFKEKSLLQLTVERNRKICQHFTIITNEELLPHALRQVEELDFYDESMFTFLCEPLARNTFPAILLTCFEKKNDLIFITPSDQVIENQTSYRESVEQGLFFAKQGKINTFGIKPRFAHTGYGYIKAQGHEVENFYEKPNLLKAKHYYRQENFYWNSGMFLVRSQILLNESRNLNFKIYEKVKATYESASRLNNIIYFCERKMKSVEALSIDYGLMEKTKLSTVVPCDFGWNDLGSFESLDQYLMSEGNSCLNYVQKGFIGLKVE